MSEETRVKLSMADLVGPPEKPYLNPFLAKGKVYDFSFVKEVRMITNKHYYVQWKFGF
jgi:hypothetical protein